MSEPGTGVGGPERPADASAFAYAIAEGSGDDVLDAWAASGTDTVMLPNGTEVRVMLPGPGALARHGVTPGVLRDIVGRMTGELSHAGMSEADWDQWEGKVRILVCAAVVAIRPPGHERFTAYRIQPEHIEQRRLPPVDYDALVAMVMRFEAPAQVDVRSRSLKGGEVSAAASVAFARSEQQTLPAWQEFIASDEGLQCALTARTFSKLPSELLLISDPVVAYSVDVALMLRLLFLKPGQKQPLPSESYERPKVEPFDPAAAAEVATYHEELLRREGKLH